MGVRGAALASIVATLAGFAYALGAFAAAGRGVDRPGWRWEEFRRVLRFGLPNGVNWFLEFAAFLFFIDVVFAGMGTAALAALMAVLQLNSIAFMPAFGLANAGAIHVGQAIGADSADSVRALVRRTLLAAAAWMGVVGVGYALAPRLLLAPFSPGSLAERTAFLAVAVPLLGWRWRGSSSTPTRWSTARRCARRATPRGPCGCASRSPGGPSSR
jgi:MATE family multidrug resistance protein